MTQPKHEKPGLGSPGKTTKKDFVEVAGTLVLSSYIFFSRAVEEKEQVSQTPVLRQGLSNPEGSDRELSVPKGLLDEAVSKSCLKDHSLQGPDTSVRHATAGAVGRQDLQLC